MNKSISVLLLLMIGAGQLLDTHSKGRRLQSLQEEIKNRHEQIAEIEESLIILRDIAAHVSEQIAYNTIPDGSEEAWIRERVNFPHMPINFKRSCRIGKQEIPMEQKLPTAVKLENKNIIPGLSPYQFKLNLEGTWEQLATYLNELKRNNKSMIITEISITPTEENNSLKAAAVIAFPQLATDGDHLRIHQLAKSSPREQQ